MDRSDLLKEYIGKKVICIFPDRTIKQGLLTEINATVSLNMCTVFLDDPYGKILRVDGNRVFPETEHNKELIVRIKEINANVARELASKEGCIRSIEDF